MGRGRIGQGDVVLLDGLELDGRVGRERRELSSPLAKLDRPISLPQSVVESRQLLELAGNVAQPSEVLILGRHRFGEGEYKLLRSSASRNRERSA